LDLRTLLSRAERISPDLPLNMERLPKEEDYAKGAEYAA
jgi:hypothetical protein